MRSVNFFLFLFALLPLTALGHDGYIAYLHPELGEPWEAFRFSDLGWIWLTYSKDTFDLVKETIDPGSWSAFVDPVLILPTVLVASVPLILLLLCMMVHKATEKLHLLRIGSRSGDYAYSGRSEKKTKVKYKRR